MNNNIVRQPKLFFLGIVFSILSSLKIYYLPEIQAFFFILLFIFGIKYSDKFRINSIAFLVLILATHHYVIPDVVYNKDPSSYPSIYTRGYGGIKILDILVIVLLVSVLPRISYLKKFFLDKKTPLILFVFLFIGFFSIPFERQAIGNLLFILRSFILALSIFLIFQKLNVVEIQRLSFLAIFCWVSKMLFSILIPHENPMYRDFFGVQWNIYFAGDEYLTLGIFSSIIILLTRKNFLNDDVIPLNVIWPKVKILLTAAFLLALIAQRKGAIYYFPIIFFMGYVENKYKTSRSHYFTNAAMFSLTWVMTLFIFFVVPILPDAFGLLFFEYNNLLDSSISSIKHLAKEDPFHFIFGLGPVGMYEIIGLLPIIDHETSFGNEVGNVFRYQIWSLPFGRMIINVGILGFVISNIYLVYNFRMRASFYYLYLSIFGIFYFGNITPPFSFALGIALAAMYKYKKNIQSLHQVTF